MKKLFIIFFLFSATCFSQIKKDSIRRIDSIKKVELKNNIASLQLKLDSILKNEQKEKKEALEEWSVNGRVNFIFNQTSFSNWLAGGENNVAGNIGVNYDFNYRNKNNINIPINPNSSAKTAKIKSVPLSGRNSSCDCVPFKKPFPNKPPEPTAILDCII